MTPRVARRERGTRPAVTPRIVKLLDEVGKRHPAMIGAWRWACEHAVLVTALLAALRSPIDALGYVNLDTPLFADAGRALVFDLDLGVFSDPKIQVGPLHLVYDGLLAGVGDLMNVRAQVPIVVASEVLFAVAFVLCFRAALSVRGRRDGTAELFAGCVAALFGLAWIAGTSSHPAEGFIPLAWVYCVVCLRTSRPLRAGLVLGLAGTIKLWALLGAPLLLLASHPPAFIASGATFAAVVAGAYAPFLAGGEVRTFDFTWTVKPQSPLAFFWEPGTTIGWTQRIVQGAGVGLVGAMGGVAFRRAVEADWALPLALVAMRLLLDPTDFHYYWLAAGTLIVFGLCLRLPARPSARHLASAVVFYATLLPFYLLRGLAFRVYIVALCAAVLLWCFKVVSSAPTVGDPASVVEGSQPAR